MYKLLNKYNRRKTVSVLLAGLMLISSGCSLLPKEIEVLKPPLVKPQKENYNLYEVKRGTITKQIKGTGIFEPSKVVYQEFKATGKITSISMKIGDTIKKGSSLFHLDSEGLEIVVMERERDLEKAKLSLHQAKESHDPQVMKIRLLELNIAQYKLNEARKQFDGKIMTAEIDGVIISMEQVKLGDLVQLGKSYVTIADPGSIRLSYNTSISGDLQEVQIGMKAEITYKNQKLEGSVTQSPASAPPTEDKQLNDKYQKTIYFKLTDSAVKPDLNANADIAIILQKKENVIVVPRFAMSALLGRTFVKVLEGESIKEMDIETGIESESEIEIVKGLKEGQKIILQ
jgi:multidrug efflux pump subunit AcrA (membrane-fusion protein)